MSSGSTTRIISICTLKHEHVWKLTSQLLPKFVHADEYIVYVPEKELKRFLKITNPAVKVLSQNILGSDYATKLKAKVDASNNSLRYGWYLQQFYKIEALLQPGADLLVIWDSDCVPLKTIKLFDNKHLPIYMNASNELNPLYFHVIETLLGLKRIQNQTFVIPGFPILNEWVHDFVSSLELRHDGIPWYEAIMACTDFSNKSGFSETETLGTWIANYHPNSWTSKDIKWERGGQSKFGYAKNFTIGEIISVGESADIDIISFENWDLRGFCLRLKQLSDIASQLKQRF